MLRSRTGVAALLLRESVAGSQGCQRTVSTAVPRHRLLQTHHPAIILCNITRHTNLRPAMGSRAASARLPRIGSCAPRQGAHRQRHIHRLGPLGGRLQQGSSTLQNCCRAGWQLTAPLPARQGTASLAQPVPRTKSRPRGWSHPLFPAPLVRAWALCGIMRDYCCCRKRTKALQRRMAPTFGPAGATSRRQRLEVGWRVL